jgi:hypothetical protein
VLKALTEEIIASSDKKAKKLSGRALWRWDIQRAAQQWREKQKKSDFRDRERGQREWWAPWGTKIPVLLALRNY